MSTKRRCSRRGHPNNKRAPRAVKWAFHGSVGDTAAGLELVKKIAEELRIPDAGCRVAGACEVPEVGYQR